MTKMSDGTFVIVYNIGGTVHFQQLDPFGNRIGDEGTLATTGVGDARPVEILAVEGNNLILAHDVNKADATRVQPFSIIDGIATQTNDISHELLIASTFDGVRTPLVKGDHA